MNARPLLLISLLLAACGRGPVNPPTEPAQPIQPPAEQAGKAPSGDYLPGRGPPTFVGDWAARPDWCANVSGEQQPIRISTDRFEGYENSCVIARIDQAGEGYEVALRCQAEGLVQSERVRMVVAGEDMRLTWLTRGGLEVRLKRCPTPEGAGPKPLEP